MTVALRAAFLTCNRSHFRLKCDLRSRGVSASLVEEAVASVTAAAATAAAVAATAAVLAAVAAEDEEADESRGKCWLK